MFGLQLTHELLAFCLPVTQVEHTNPYYIVAELYCIVLWQDNFVCSARVVTFKK